MNILYLKTPGEYATAALDEPVVHLVIGFPHFPLHGMKLTRYIQVRYLPHKYKKKQEMFFLDAIASPGTHPGQ